MINYPIINDESKEEPCWHSKRHVQKPGFWLVCCANGIMFCGLSEENSCVSVTVLGLQISPMFNFA